MRSERCHACSTAMDWMIDFKPKSKFVWWIYVNLCFCIWWEIFTRLERGGSFGQSLIFEDRMILPNLWKIVAWWSRCVFGRRTHRVLYGGCCLTRAVGENYIQPRGRVWNEEQKRWRERNGVTLLRVVMIEKSPIYSTSTIHFDSMWLVWNLCTRRWKCWPCWYQSITFCERRKPKNALGETGDNHLAGGREAGGKKLLDWPRPTDEMKWNHVSCVIRWWRQYSLLDCSWIATMISNCCNPFSFWFEEANW